MVKLTVDEKNISVPKGTMLLEAARSAGISIPTLCAHEAVSRSGACRLCVVEIKKGNRTRIVTSCLYGAEEGLVVDTRSERVLNVRRLVMELLLARCPESEVLQKLAKELGVEPQARFVADSDKGKCILCRSCVRVCEEIVGVSAIGFFARGSRKNVTFKMQTCAKCGKFFAPVDQLKFISKKTGVPLNELTVCTECR
jgi:bidirectional [NiFe] hydrogenase diaphorase subunit